MPKCNHRFPDKTKYDTNGRIVGNYRCPDCGDLPSAAWFREKRAEYLGKPVVNLCDLKPAHTCKCGEDYAFAVPKFCRKCGLPILVEGPNWVKFSPTKYQQLIYNKEIPMPKTTILSNKPPTLEEAQGLVDGYVQMLTLRDGSQMLVNEDGIALNLEVNQSASERAEHFGPILGNVLILRGKARWV